MRCDRTDCGSLFHSAGEAIAKPRLPMVFLGKTEETDSLFPRDRLLVLIKYDKYTNVCGLGEFDGLENNSTVFKLDAVCNREPV